MGRDRRPRFFKIILPCVLGNHKLRIPPAFIKNFGHHLSGCDSVYLQTPTGSVWEVELTKYQGHHWLQKGWQEFAEYHSIAYGDFLVFKFRGDSLFRVIICDMNASEIEYPVGDIAMSCCDPIELDDEMASRAPEVGGGPPNTDGREWVGDGVSVEVLDDRPPNTVKTRARAERVEPSSTVRAKKRSTLDQRGSLRDMQSKRSCSAGERSHNTITSDAKDRAVRRAEALKCKGPSFMVQMRPSLIYNTFCVHIPSRHVREYLAGKHVHVALMVPELEKKTWLVRCYIHPRSSKLKTGWKGFALDNHLAVGDVCVFELIQTNLYKVFIFRAAQDRKPCNNTHHCTVKDEVPQSVRAEDHGYVRPPTIRSKKQGNPDQRGLPQGEQSKRSRTAVKPVGKETRRSYFQRKVSHICTSFGSERALQSARDLKCNGPSFMVQIQPSHISRGFRVQIPAHHFRECSAGKHDNFVLTGPRMETRLVRCYSHPTGARRLATGWKDFALDNHLVVGDVCVFELIKKNSYKVMIFRAADEGDQVHVSRHGAVRDRLLPRSEGKPADPENLTRAKVKKH